MCAIFKYATFQLILHEAITSLIFDKISAAPLEDSRFTRMNNAFNNCIAYTVGFHVEDIEIRRCTLTSLMSHSFILPKILINLSDILLSVKFTLGNYS